MAAEELIPGVYRTGSSPPRPAQPDGALRGLAVLRFPLSLQMVEEMLAFRGIVVSHETARQWSRKFGQGFANQTRHRLPRPGDKWQLDEVVLKIAGVTR